MQKHRTTVSTNIVKKVYTVKEKRGLKISKYKYLNFNNY